MAILAKDIAAAIANEDTRASVFSELIRKIDHALELNQKAHEAEQIRLVDPTNENPEKSQATLEKIKLSEQRLKAALPILEFRYSVARHREELEEVKPKYNAVVERYNTFSETLGNLYKEFVEQAIPMLQEAIGLNHDIRQMNDAAKRFDEFPLIPLIAERLLAELKLPSQNGFYWPDEREQNAFVVQASNLVSVVMAGKAQAYSADWAAAREQDNAQKMADLEKRNELQKQQAEAAKQEFYEAQRQAARGE